MEGYRPEQLACGTGAPSDIDNLYTETLLRCAFAALEIEHPVACAAAIPQWPSTMACPRGSIWSQASQFDKGPAGPA
jgi:hypothetical protein